MTTTQLMLHRQEMLKAMRLLSTNVIDESEYEDIKQLYMDAYLTYMQY